MAAIEEIDSILVLPRLQVQNVNMVSSPMTWGFPSMTAFTGLMWALQRKLPAALAAKVKFKTVGVVCHKFEPQASKPGGYQYSLHLTRNPVDHKGATKSISQEGRAHVNVTVLLGMSSSLYSVTPEERTSVAQEIYAIVEAMRIAGGTIVPRTKTRRFDMPELFPIAGGEDDRLQQFKTLRRRLLPGNTLVLRKDLLAEKNESDNTSNSEVSLVDSWLDFSKLVYLADESSREDVASSSGKEKEKVEWILQKRSGWLVPIPTGYSALSGSYTGGTVTSARDGKTDFRFVESTYSIGQWISPHRLYDFSQLMWYPQTDRNLGVYQCTNDYASFI
jgi:CRISPR-associated protein Csy2